MEEETVRKQAHRRTVDHGNSFSRWVVERKMGRTGFGGASNVYRIEPEPSQLVGMMPPQAYRGAAASSLITKFTHTSMNKIRQPIFVVKWTPEGRRILTGSMAGEFTLWNGMTFNFETIMQAHDNAVRALAHSHSDEWLLSGDHEGKVKFWQTNFNNVNIINAHREIVRDIAFSPNDAKFVTASDDGTLKIWNFNDATEERALTGHGWDVKCADWHPTLGLIASGSKDNLVKLWDPRAPGKNVATLHGFKNTIMRTKFQRTGGRMMLASSSRDQTARVLDLRTMTDVVVLRGHNADVPSLTWHPVHPNLITTGSQSGAISHFLIDTPLPENTIGLMPAAQIVKAHDFPIWSLDYHPLGHLLASASNDKTTRIWSRSRPGDTLSFTDRYHVLPPEGEEPIGHHGHHHGMNTQRRWVPGGGRYNNGGGNYQNNNNNNNNNSFHNRNNDGSGRGDNAHASRRFQQYSQRKLNEIRDGASAIIADMNGSSNQPDGQQEGKPSGGSSSGGAGSSDKPSIPGLNWTG